MSDHDGVVSNGGLTHVFTNHEGGEDNKRVGRAHEKIPALKFFDRRFSVPLLLREADAVFGSQIAA